jgi:hypothetical protein
VIAGYVEKIIARMAEKWGRKNSIRKERKQYVCNPERTSTYKNIR